MLDVAVAILRLIWPFVLAAGVWGWQEVRVLDCRSSLATSHKREIAVQSQLDAAQSQLKAARQRATDLALLYADALPKIDAAAREQEAADRVRLDSLNDRIRALSRVPDVRISPAAGGVLDDITAAANGRDAGSAAQPEGRAAAVPAVPEAVVSEHDVVGFVAVAADAYRSAVRMFHECRDLYNAARNAQIGVSK